MNATTLLRESLNALIHGETLTVDRADAVMTAMTDATVPVELIGGTLCALAARGERTEEIAGFARAMRRLARTVPHDFHQAVDTCGTGGDGRHTLNISTAGALLAAAAGLPVLKHGNRAVSSRCGSADVLEALGVLIPSEPETAARMLSDTNFVFLFAPYFHPAMKNVAPVRRNLGVRTVFNILGPLVNPGMVRYQVIGMFSPSLMEKLAPVFHHLGHQRVLLVHHEAGYDEALSTGRTLSVVFDHGEIREMTIRGESFGFANGDPDALTGGDATYNASVIENLFRRPGDADPTVRETIVLNAALAMYAAEVVPTLESGLDKVERVLQEGGAMELLQKLRTYRVEG